MKKMIKRLIFVVALVCGIPLYLFDFIFVQLILSYILYGDNFQIKFFIYCADRIQVWADKG